MLLYVFHYCSSLSLLSRRVLIRRSAIKMTTTTDYPVQVKAVVSRLTSNMQKALQDQISRIEVELPPGVNYGVESSSKSKPSDEDFKRSNREAARLITEMFSILSSTITVIFPTESEAFQARSIWSGKFKGSVVSLEAPVEKGFGKLRSRKFTAEEQEKALLGTDGVYIPDGTELLIIAGSKPKDLKKIRQIHEKLGEQTLIILLNVRVGAANVLVKKDGSGGGGAVDDDQLVAWFRSTFINVFNYAPPILSASVIKDQRDLLVFHEYKKSWFLAEQVRSNDGILGLKLGESSKFVTHWEGTERPNDSQIEALYLSLFSSK